LLRAIIFDFDGIIVNSEPLIMQLTQAMAAQEGWTITEEEYYHEYLALDDRGIIQHLYQRHGRPLNAARRDELLQWKMRAYAEAIRNGLPPQPGAVDFVLNVAGEFPLAIASGSLRSEIEYLLKKLGVRDKFAVLATAEDAEHSKPDPEVFVKALGRLREVPLGTEESGHQALRAADCLVIEDAPAGIEAAHAAGMRCLALAHSRPRNELGKADWLFAGFPEIDFPRIRVAFDASQG